MKVTAILCLLLGLAWVGKGIVHFVAGKPSGYWADDFTFGGVIVVVAAFAMIRTRGARARRVS